MAELTPSGTFSAQAIAKGLKPGLYAITDSQLLPEDRLLVAVEAALRGGAVLVPVSYTHLTLPTTPYV